MNLKKSLANIYQIFNGRHNAIRFVHEYASMILKIKRKVTEEEPEPEPSKAKTKCKNLHLDSANNLQMN